MKNILFIAIIVMMASNSYAQNDIKDTVKKSADTTKNNDNSSEGDYGQVHWRKKRHVKSTAYPKPYFGVTFSRADLGFATLIDNGSFTLSKQNQFLSYQQSKTSNVGFDVLQMGVKFSRTFKIYLSGGFDWTLFRLRDNITILPNQPALTYRQDNIDYSKNRFSSSYLRIPLSFDFRSNESRRGNRFHFVIGPEVGFLLDGMVKQISNENGKQKFSNNYNFTTFRYGGVARIGYGDFGIFAKYYANDMFENSPQQQGLKNFSFGLMLGF
jgi:Outer membrane protein beta-barrel domain